MQDCAPFIPDPDHTATALYAVGQPALQVEGPLPCCGGLLG